MTRPRATWLKIELPGRMRYALTLDDGLSVKRLREAATKPHLKYYRDLRQGLRNRIRQNERALEAIEADRKFGEPKVAKGTLRAQREMLDELGSPTALLHIAEEVEWKAAQQAAGRAEDERYWRAQFEQQWQRTADRFVEQLERQGYQRAETFRQLLGLPTLSHSRALTVLGLPSTATPAEIRSRYRALALQHHPDRGGDEARMREINAAYTTLQRRG